MKTIRLKLLVLTAVLPMLFGNTEGGCGAPSEPSSSVQQDQIFVQYWLFYDANTDITSARATFRFGNALGTTLQLAAPAKVTFEGQTMAFVPSWGWHELQLSGPVTGTFEYVDTAGHSSTSVVSAFSKASLPPEVDFTHGQAQSVAWVGEPVAEGEDFEFIVAGQNALDFTRIDVTAIGSTTAVFPTTSFARFNGQGSVSVRRHLKTDAPGTAVGGSLTVTWQPVDAKARFAGP